MAQDFLGSLRRGWIERATDVLEEAGYDAADYSERWLELAGDLLENGAPLMPNMDEQGLRLLIDEPVDALWH